MRSDIDVVQAFYDKWFPDYNRTVHKADADVGVARAGMSEVLAEVVERQKKCELEYGGVMPPRDDPRHEGWCVYCWACAELEKLKGEP